jgi:hypothetical protein
MRPFQTLLVLTTIGWSIGAGAQKSDVLLLQKKGRTIASYFPGTNLSCLTTDRVPVAGRIDSLKRDSVFLTHFDVRRITTPMGAQLADTVGKFSLSFSVANLGYFPYQGRQPQGFWGRLLLLGGAGFLLVNTVNTLREKDALFGKDNLPRVLGALGGMGLGVALTATEKDLVKLGGKYRLKYLIN